MKVLKVSFRDAVGTNPVSGFDSAAAAMELHPAGVLISPKGANRMLVPFSNIKAVTLTPAEEKKP